MTPSARTAPRPYAHVPVRAGDGAPAWLAVVGAFALMMVLAAVLGVCGTAATMALLDGADGAATPPAAAITSR